MRIPQDNADRTVIDLGFGHANYQLCQNHQILRSQNDNVQIPSLWLIERLGRRVLSLVQLTGCLVTLSLLAGFIALSETRSETAQFWRSFETENFDVSKIFGFIF